MPTSSQKKRSRWIPTAIRRKLQSMPCNICGIPFDIHCDHIAPFFYGGESVDNNLQPLCRDCNYAKKHLLSNDETRIVIKIRGIKHFTNSAYRWGVRFYNPYSAPSFSEWEKNHPMEIAEANALFIAFSGESAP